MVKEAIELMEGLRQAKRPRKDTGFCGRLQKGAMRMHTAFWDGAGFHVDEALASVHLKESVRRGSSHGVLCALRAQDPTPSVAREMPFASTKEAFLLLYARRIQAMPLAST